MKPRYKALLAFAVIMLGGLISGIAFTETFFGPQLGTVIFCVGDVMILGGLILFVVALIQRIKR